MSIISGQVRELRYKADIYNTVGSTWELNRAEAKILQILLRKAADTIEALSEKLAKNGGWISCSERLPDKGVMNPITNDYAEYLCTVCVDGFRTVRPIKFDKDGCWVNHGMNFDKYVTAWQPLPEEYHG